MAQWGVTRFAVRLLVPELYSSYRTANAALAYLKTVGLSYRRTDFLRDWREILDFEAKIDLWKYVPKGKVISASSFTPTEKDLTTKYQYIGKVTYRNAAGISSEKDISFGFDTELSAGQIDEELEALAEKAKDLYQVTTVKSVKFIGAIKRR